MSTLVTRPRFSENQILSAADVNGIVAHARAAAARHNREVHDWGIASGLTLGKEDRSDTSGAYVEVTLAPGLAIDGSGREIVVTETVRLREELFDELNVAESDPEVLYPVLLRGRDRAQQGSASAASACLGGQSTRTVESFDVTFGRVGDGAALGEQTRPDVGDGPGDGGWSILLGFVKWNGSRFTDVSTQDGDTRVRYVGVRAEDVAAQNDRLTLRSADRTIQDKAALVIDNENDGEMRFGLQNAAGEVVPVFTVNSKGDVHAEGKILGAIAGGVQVESGVASDGALVPLPAGITQEQVDAGEASIQVHVSPRYQQPASLPLTPPGPNQFWVMQPLECYADGRRVVCRVLWVLQDPGAGTFPDHQVMSGVCDYQLVAFVAEGD